MGRVRAMQVMMGRGGGRSYWGGGLGWDGG